MSQSNRSLSRFWSDYGTEDFARLDLARAIAVLPLGATEQHGPHLPLSVDVDLVDGVIQAAVSQLPQDLPVLILPTQQVGFSPEHQAFAGTLSLSAETVMRIWTELGESVASSGIRKLVLFNAHGGHTGLMEAVGRDLRARLGMLVYSASWFNLPLEEAGQTISADEERFGVHAGQMETAMMLALKPGRVLMEKALNFSSSTQQRARDFPILGNGKSAKLAWQMQDYNPAGAAGNAAAATKEQGQVLLAAAASGLGKLLIEIDRLPADVLRQPPKPKM
ncbi:MAG: creatininase family protein [Hylemonella sp.]